MKRDFLEAIEVNGAKLPKEVIDSIMDENGKDVHAGKDAVAAKVKDIEALTVERDGLKEQIKSRDKDIETLKTQSGNNAELKDQLTKLQSKYDDDTTALKTKIAEQNFDHATERFFSGYEFTSPLAKKAAIAEFKEQKFKLRDDGTFEGGEQWIDALKKDNPAAFKEDQDPDPNPQGNGGNGKPHFSSGGGAEPKKLSLADAMKMKNDNPNAQITFD